MKELLFLQESTTNNLHNIAVCLIEYSEDNYINQNCSIIKIESKDLKHQIYTNLTMVSNLNIFNSEYLKIPIRYGLLDKWEDLKNKNLGSATVNNNDIIMLNGIDILLWDEHIHHSKIVGSLGLIKEIKTPQALAPNKEMLYVNEILKRL